MGTSTDAAACERLSPCPSMQAPILRTFSTCVQMTHLLSSSVMSRRCSSDWSDLRLTLPRGPTVVTTPSRSTSAWQDEQQESGGAPKRILPALLLSEHASAALDEDMLFYDMLLRKLLQPSSVLPIHDVASQLQKPH